MNSPCFSKKIKGIINQVLYLFSVNLDAYLKLFPVPSLFWSNLDWKKEEHLVGQTTMDVGVHPPLSVFADSNGRGYSAVRNRTITGWQSGWSGKGTCLTSMRPWV
jgi:hypothetical protein